MEVNILKNIEERNKQKMTELQEKMEHILKETQERQLKMREEMYNKMKAATDNIKF